MGKVFKWKIGYSIDDKSLKTSPRPKSRNNCIR